MTTSQIQIAALFLCLAVIGLIFSTQIDHAPLLLMIVIPVGIAAGILLLKYPFIALTLIVFTTQIDALVETITPNLPLTVFETLSLITLAGIVIKHVSVPSKNQFEYLRSPIVMYYLLFAIAVLASSIFARDIERSINAVKHMAAIYLLVFMIFELVDSEKKVKLIFSAIMGSTTISALFVLFDWYTGSSILGSTEAATTGDWNGVVRSSGASNESSTLAASMLLAGTTLSLILALRLKSLRWLAVPTVLIGSAAIVFTLTRHTSIVYVALLIWCLLKFRQSSFFPFAIFCTIASVFVLLPFIPEELWQRLDIMFEPGQDSTILRRLSYHIIGLELLIEHPITGIGVGNFPQYFSDFDFRWIPGRTDEERPLHNIYLKFATETGIFGFCLFVAIILKCLQGLSLVLKNTDGEISVYAEALQFSLAGVLAESLFLSSGFNKYLWIYLALCGGSYFIFKRLQQPDVDRGHMTALRNNKFQE